MPGIAGLAACLAANNMIYAPNADYNLYALNLHGELQWTFEADQSIWGAPVSDGTNIYFGTLGRKVYAVNAQTGKQVWVQKVDGAVLGSPVLGTDNTLYVGSYGGTVYALNTATGSTHSLANGFLLDLVRSGPGWHHPLFWGRKWYAVCSSRERYWSALEPAIERCHYWHTACQRRQHHRWDGGRKSSISLTVPVRIPAPFPFPEKCTLHPLLPET